MLLQPPPVWALLCLCGECKESVGQGEDEMSYICDRCGIVSPFNCA